MYWVRRSTLNTTRILIVGGVWQAGCVICNAVPLCTINSSKLAAAAAAAATR